MMYTLKGRYAVMTIFLFALSRGDLFTRTRQQQRYNSAIPAFPWHLTPSWEYMLHEIILKSVTPPQQDANVPYKRPLDASFYGGPINMNFSDDVNVLSRGNVYRLLNGHWMLCQDGCVDCEPCVAQRNPLFKWVLQRVKQLPVSDLPRHDLQLTIMPQSDDRFLASNVWPNSYVYVTSQSEQAPVSIVRMQYNNRESFLSNLENNFFEQRSKDFWRSTPQNSTASQDKIPSTDNRVTVQENASTEQPKKEESAEQRDGLKNTRRYYRPRPKLVEEQDQSINLAPRLILGTDQQGQKHLIHLIPAERSSIIANRSQFVTDQATRLNDTIPKREKQAYQWIFRKIFDSLNTHRQSIENFLESSPNNAQRIPPSTDNMEAVGSSWRNRDTRHMSARNVEPLRFNATLPSLYGGNEDEMGRYRYRSKYGYENTEQNVNNYYTRYRDANQDIMLRRPSLIDLNRNGDRQKMHESYFVDGKNNSRINSLVALKNSDNSSLDDISIDSSDSFVIHSGKQINPNDTFIDKASNNSAKLSSITIKRENEQLFKSELENSDANREFDSRHSFKIIVTTASPIIRREHETRNRTKTLQITTSKSFVNNQ